MPLQSAPTLAAIAWDADAPVIIDQRRLPDDLVHWRLDTVDAVVEAIHTLAVRGAPAIGITGGYGMVVGLDETGGSDLGPDERDALGSMLDALAARLASARPTAVNLSMAVRRVHRAAAAAPDGPSARAAALAEATALEVEDRASCAAIAANGRIALAGARRLLTHCNTGRLATAGDGTALAIVYAMDAAGELDEVLACEARPLLQGARLTAWELAQAGVPVPAHRGLGRRRGDGRVAWWTPSSSAATASRRTATRPTRSAPTASPCWRGTTASRSGSPDRTRPSTSTRPTVRPSSSRSATPTRCGPLGGHRLAPADAPAWNPAFDITPAALIAGYITDVGHRPTPVRVRAPIAHEPRGRVDGASVTELETRGLLVELLGAFYAKGWVSGTGGGICGPADGGNLLLAPTGVHKERVQPDEFFVVDPADGHVLRPPDERRPAPERVQLDLLPRGPQASRRQRRPLARPIGGPVRRPGRGRRPRRDRRTSRCSRASGASATATSTSCRSSATPPREPELVEQLRPVLADPRFGQSAAVIVADHGAYIWGDGRVGGQAPHRGLPLPVRGRRRAARTPRDRSAARTPQGGSRMTAEHDTRATSSVRRVSSTSRTPGSTSSTSQRRWRRTS